MSTHNLLILSSFGCIYYVLFYHGTTGMFQLLHTSFSLKQDTQTPPPQTQHSASMLETSSVLKPAVNDSVSMPLRAPVVCITSEG